MSETILSYHQRHEAVTRLASEIGQLNKTPWTPYHWTYILLQLQLSNEAQQAIVFPLRAISVAFNALSSQDASLKKRALQYYSRSLALQKQQIAMMGRDRESPSGESILLPLLMGLLLFEFEMMVPLSLYSWMGHANGSVQLLACIGPEACQVSPFLEIFGQLRFAMVSSTAAELADHRY